MSNEFQNKVVLITGGASGIGKATAARFLNEGASVVINGRDETKLQETLNELNPSGTRLAIVAGDIGQPETAQRLVATAVQRFGGVDILINNAGIFRPTPFLDHTPDDLDGYLNVVVRGTFYASQAAIPEMIKRHGGSIVNTGSLWALQAVGATPSAAYSAAMAGRHALTRNLAIEFAASNIRVNAVAPAVIATPIYQGFMTTEQVDTVLPTFASMHPLGRLGLPDDVVEAILFLAGPRSAFITGVVLPVDGGVMSGLPAPQADN